ncbi:MAG TPA: hypothetical protein VGE10_00485 [Zeimonas sp.]
MGQSISDARAPQARPSGRRDRWLVAAAVLAIVFGLATIRAGARVLFGVPDAVAAAGNYVPFVLWFNFAAGFLYVIAGVGFWLHRRWGSVLAAAIAAATLVVFAAFALHIVTGGAWEPRTLAAMTLRSAVWIGLALVAARRIPKN